MRVTRPGFGVFVSTETASLTKTATRPGYSDCDLMIFL